MLHLPRNLGPHLHINSSRHTLKFNLHVFENRPYEDMFQRRKNLERAKKLKVNCPKADFLNTFVRKKILLSYLAEY